MRKDKVKIMKKNSLRVMALGMTMAMAMSLSACAVSTTGAAGSTVLAGNAAASAAVETTADAANGSSITNEASGNTISGAATSGNATSGSATSGTLASGTEASSGTATTANVTSDGAIDATDLFSIRDLEQEADLTDAVYYTVEDGQDITITEEGVYVFSGTASEVSIIVETEDAKVQLVLDGLNITNSDSPCIYVKSADKVWVTTTEDSDNALFVTGTFNADGETNTDAAIYSKDDLVLNGLGTLTITSTDNGITSKDDLKVTGGTYEINCASDGLEANESIRIADGTITITTKKDGMHAENDEDDTVGYIYICGGEINISASSDGIQATTILQIDGGTVNVSAQEGLEATCVQINDGTVNVSATDDGINASYKSTACTCAIEINGGYITIAMGQGDTDAVDSNGSIYVNGGTIDITAQSSFDYDYYAEYNGGTIIVNGTVTNAITNQMMGGQMGGMGQMGGQPGSMGQSGMGQQGFGGQMGGGHGGR